MNSDRRGFFRRLLGLGALAVSGQIIPPADAREEFIRAEKAANPFIITMIPGTVTWVTSGGVSGCASAVTSFQYIEVK